VTNGLIAFRGGRPAPSGLILAITVNGIMVNALVAPIAPDIAVDLGRSAGAAAALLVAASLPGIFFAPVVGLLADRRGRRCVLVRCLVVYGVSGIAGGAAPSFGFLLAARVLQGIGSAGLVQLSIVLIGDHRSGRAHDQLIGYNAAVLAAAPAVLPLLAGAFTAHWGWRYVFAAYAMALMTAVAVRLLLDETVALEGVNVSRQLRTGAAYLRDRRTRQSIGVGLVVFVLVYGMTLTVLPIVLVTRLDIGPLGRGVLLALPAITSTAASASAGWLSSRVTERGIVIVGLGALAAASLLTGVGTTTSVAMGALLAGLGEGLVIPGLLIDLNRSVAPSNRAAITATWVCAARAGQTVGSGAAGFSLTSFGLSRTSAIAACLGVLTVAWLEAHPAELHGAPQ
jgi:MFS transporter, ACDE family, multidrug resistance protein